MKVRPLITVSREEVMEVVLGVVDWNEGEGWRTIMEKVNRSSSSFCNRSKKDGGKDGGVSGS